MQRLKTGLFRFSKWLNTFWQENDGWIMFLLAVSLCLLLLPVYDYRYQDGVDGDFSLHLLFTRMLLQGRLSEMPGANQAHLGLQYLVAAAYYLTNHKITLVWLNILILTFAQVVTALGIYLWFGKSERKVWSALKAVLALGVIFSAPVMALAPLDGRYYFGYIGLASYHSPTVILLRPFALFSLWLISNQIGPLKPAGIGKIALSAFLVIYSALVKPSYVFSFLPIIILYCAWMFIRKQWLDVRFWLLGVVLPGIGVLGIQGIVAYLLPGENSSQIVFAPFAVESSFSGFLVYKFVLSILFVLAAIAVLGQELRKDPLVLLTTLAFLSGAAQNYFLAESGARFFDGNFRWGAQIMLFLLFIVLLRSWLSGRFLKGNSSYWENALVFGTLALHAAAGAVYYIYVLTHVGYG